MVADWPLVVALPSMLSRVRSDAPVKTEEVEQRITNGQRALARMRLKAGVSMLALGLALGAALTSADYFRDHGEAERCGIPWTAYLLGFVESVLYNGRFAVFGLMPLVDDMLMMRLVMLLDLAVQVSNNIIIFRSAWGSGRMPPLAEVTWQLADMVLYVGVCGAMCCRAAAPMQRRMWGAISAWLCSTILLSIFFAVATTAQCRFPSEQWFWLPGKLMLLGFASQPQLRWRCQAALLALLECRSEVLAAAGLAGLVGRCSAKTVVAEAKTRFRVVELSALRPADVADNAPDPALLAKSRPACPRECDAFVSHSWHDDAGAKWAALQRWRRAFLREHGREPRVWLDKCCIDQNNISADLRCLPVFLSGCQRLVVFCGPTYLSRLWCIVELFTFVLMGRSAEKIEFELVFPEGHEEEHSRELDNSFEHFDAQLCSCFCEGDKERMLSIILAAFGSMDGFNKAVSAIFHQARLRDLVRQKCPAKDRQAFGGCSSSPSMSDASSVSTVSSHESGLGDDDVEQNSGAG